MAPGTILKIAYEAPDIEEVDGLKQKDQPDANYMEDGLDARYNRERKAAVDAIERADLNIHVVHRPILSLTNQKQTDTDDVYTASQTRPKVNRERYGVTSKTGEIHFRTDESIDGYVEICLQSYVASSKRPDRIALSISSSEENYKLFEEVINSKPKILHQSPPQGETTEMNEGPSVVEGETNFIIEELNRMERSVMDVFRKIQASTKRSDEFREQSVKLNKAVRNWPIFRICGLLIGGYLQVSSVLAYMKRKHIY